MALRTLAKIGLGLALIGTTACNRQEPGVDCVLQPPSPGDDAVCLVPGWSDRDFLIHLPPDYDAGGAYPLVVALHGGGGAKEGMNPLTCRDGDEGDPGCLTALAEREGFIVVYPDGVANNLGFRSWNQGGDAPGLQCPNACEQGIDDVAYARALLDEVQRVAGIDPKRVYFTGFSNGAGMSHRLSCELAERIAASAPVGGANQFALSHECAPSRPIPVLQIHGSADPCWPYAGGEGSCLAVQEGTYAAVESSLIGTAGAPGWALRNGCDPTPELSSLPDADGDGDVTRERRFVGCDAEVVLMTVEGAGHTWPGGDQYLDTDRIGGLSRDFAASQRIWEFFRDKRLP